MLDTENTYTAVTIVAVGRIYENSDVEMYACLSDDSNKSSVSSHLLATLLEYLLLCGLTNIFVWIVPSRTKHIVIG